MNTSNEESKQPIEKAGAETRSPSKTEGGLTATNTDATEIETEVVRTLVVPNALTKSEDDPRSPTKTNRDLPTTVIPEATSEPEEVRKPLLPEE
jgi:hypothetical protein